MLRFGCSYLGHITDLVHVLRESLMESSPNLIGPHFSRLLWDSEPMALTVLNRVRSDLGWVHEVFGDSSVQVPGEVWVLDDSGSQLWPKLSQQSNFDFFPMSV